MTSVPALDVKQLRDRLAAKPDSRRRLTDSVETALRLAEGLVIVDFVDLPEDDPGRTRRFSEKRGDWAAFEDAKIEGYKRAQHRFIGAGGSGKHDDPTVIPAEASSAARALGLVGTE